MKSSRLTILMTLVVLLGFGIILAMNMAALAGFVPEKYISPNEVRGASVEHAGVEYTLNFKQQNTLVDIINRSAPTTTKDINTRKTDQLVEASKITIYRFNLPAVEIKPITYLSTQYSKNALAFETAEWNSGGALEESVAGEFHSLLDSAYDH